MKKSNLNQLDSKKSFNFLESKFFLLVLIFVGSTLFGQSLNYNVSVRRLLSPEGKEHLNSLDDDGRRDFVDHFQYPQHSRYTLYVSDNYSAISNQDKHFSKEVNLPLGKGKAFRVKNKPVVIFENTEVGIENYVTSNLKDINWTDTKKDSVILDLKVYQAKGIHEPTGIVYTIWYTKDLPKGLGIHSLEHDKGFVVAFKSILNNPDNLTKKLVVHAFPDRKVNLPKEVIEGIDNKVKVAVNNVDNTKSVKIKTKSRKI